MSSKTTVQKPIRGIIHWGKREQIDHRMESFYDITVYTVPFSGSYDENAVWAAFAGNRFGGVSGNLLYGGRGFRPTGLDPKRPNHILVEFTFAIGD